MSRIRPVLGAFGAVVVLAAAGCGGSSDDDPQIKKAAQPATTTTAAQPAAKKPAGPAPSKAAYIKRADRICLQASKISAKANAAFNKAITKRQPVQAAEAIDRYTPAYEAKINQVHDLRQPAHVDKILTSLHKLLDVEVQALKAESLAIRNNDAQRIAQIGQAQSKAKEFADTLAMKYGFKVCGRSV
jgi:hypothetical protein